MKKIYLFVSCAILLAACHSGPSQADIALMRQHIVDSIRIDSMKAAEAKKREEAIRRQREEARVADAPAPAAPKKKGWSGAAKGAVIGAGAGAVAGAVIDKNNRGAGAVIGGLSGAGVGAATGAIIDHNKKKKKKQQ